MLTNLRLQNFKSWSDTGKLRLAPITGFFGANSSGKSSLLQAILLLKQTAESNDVNQVLNLGGERSYIDFGTFQDIIHHKDESKTINFELGWDDPPEEFELETSVKWQDNQPKVDHFEYRFGTSLYGLRQNSLGRYSYYSSKQQNSKKQSQIQNTNSNSGTSFQLVKIYKFSDLILIRDQSLTNIFTLIGKYEYQMKNIYYLGPLRAEPQRLYLNVGGQPQDVGQRGEKTIATLLAPLGLRTLYTSKKNQTHQELVATWLQKLGLVESFRINQIAPSRKEYEVLLKLKTSDKEVLLTEVGFGISQILPVLTLCYYVPEGSTIIFEQPELHLHPAVQAGLADVFIDAIKTRGVQIIFESHSEHLLQRMQRRIAEEQIKSTDTAFYFCSAGEGTSKIEELQLNEYGEISNWPQDFFGNMLEEAVLTTEAIARRQQKQGS